MEIEVYPSTTTESQEKFKELLKSELKDPETNSIQLSKFAAFLCIAPIKDPIPPPIIPIFSFFILEINNIF